MYFNIKFREKHYFSTFNYTTRQDRIVKAFDLYSLDKNLCRNSHL